MIGAKVAFKGSSVIIVVINAPVTVARRPEQGCSMFRIDSDASLT